MILNKNLIAFGLASLMLSSCGGEKENETLMNTDSTSVAVDTVAVTVSDTTKFKFDFAIANIPSPASSLQDLANLGVAYDNTILNDIKKAGNYSTEFQRSLNLGVYNIDMAYAMINDKGQDVLQYMKDVLIISDALGLKNAVSVMVGKRAEQNLSNRDSLFKILDEIFVKSDSYLRTNERVYTAALVFAGSWVESLYLNCKISEQSTNVSMKDQARKQLWEQRFHLGNLIDLLGDYKDKKECADLIADLKPIHNEIVAIKQPTDLGDAQFGSIASKIMALRTKVTK